MRRYNVWAGNPQGTPENSTQCLETILTSRVLSVQCNGKRRPSGLCAKHERQYDKCGWAYPQIVPVAT